MSNQSPGHLEFIANGEDDTVRLGKVLADALEPGIVVALVGDLGAGKTRLVQAIAAAMGVEREEVNSPTFVLIQEYDGRLPIYHFDAFRLHDTDEFLELGADEMMDSHAVCLIEWADRVADALPRDLLRIEIAIVGPTVRVFHISGSGPRSNAVVGRLSIDS
jgi:tRNA threonylcarbamoyladenosine biosynthesis protein TsaE